MRKMVLIGAALVVPAAVLGIRLGMLPGAQPARPPTAIVPAAFATIAPQPQPALAPAAPDDLPAIAVMPLAAHAVPSDADTAPAQPYTIVPLDHAPDRRVVAERSPPVPAHVRRRPVPVATGPMRLTGRAHAEGGLALRLEGMTVRLFGVSLARLGDGAAARAALARQFASSSVTCDAPPGQAGAMRYVCRDAAGTDLGERLVAQGLAVADRSSSFQYVSDEEAARAKRAGLWSSR
jgi:endonuclease YncB( thermonuclease family)